MSLLKLCLAAALVLLCVCDVTEAKRKLRKRKKFVKPHIVFVMADDYGFNDIGYNAKNHHSQMKTPFLDSLASKLMDL